ncbi:uncharacterized protein HMPREF1541_01951 [Cyphellophora europaea CBS 101466]|uniref:Zn(2)-C6 fungal-type domain-containing protein n=1 Tax=Cyphellophora europaea (strain CBS 101466) TaxID=1220924 RepID=W2S414_CYPE1|nr:uncharacterized protein HMPREF1541_01951 [Cyphellophora europaea CBS 101466]ETN42793.1 hypothetical protein HMPREF1541_01951 [Cyphellophora europaea CBS 101466]
MSSTQPAPGAKTRRITRACDYCHRRAIRCLRDGNASQCLKCLQFSQPCTYARPAKRRGVKPGSQAISPSAPANVLGNSRAKTDSQSRLQWTAPLIASQAVVLSLAEVYFEVVYPIFPFFHQPTYLRRIARAEYTSDRHLFSTTMALCALVSARVQDQALFNTSYDMEELTKVPCETFYEAAVQASVDVTTETSIQSLDLLRTCALLSLTAVQCGKIRDMQRFLGRYHTLVAMDRLQDESNWPTGIGIVETEERRRLFWSMYTFEIYVSIVWNSVTRVREQQVNVAYTTEIDDELFSDRGYSSTLRPLVDLRQSPTSRPGQVASTSWLCGWNFTTDLYRVLEHVIASFGNRKRHQGSFPMELFVNRSATSISSVRDVVMQQYTNLPYCFKVVSQLTCDPASDRFGFQAANITATVQLLRMMLFASGGGSIEDRCKIASEVIDAFTQIPVAYLRAISSPLLHHLAGIGSILGSVFEEPMSEHAYEQVRVVLLALAQLLENLEHGIHATKSAQRLRDLVAQIDDYMNSQRDQSSNLPTKLANEIMDEWPWNLDFMQLAESWSSTEGQLDL